MFDLGESRTEVLAMERENLDVKLLMNNGSVSFDSLVGVKGDSTWYAMFLEAGEGVNGKRPPAVREEKRVEWLFSGVETETVAIVKEKSCQGDKRMPQRLRG